MATTKNFQHSYYNYVNGIKLKPCYFIKFDLTIKENMNEMILYHKNYLNFNLIEAKLFLKNKTELLYEYCHLYDWVKAIDNFSALLNQRASFKIYCNDELIGEKDHIVVAYA